MKKKFKKNNWKTKKNSFTGSTSILFLVCVSPMAILHMTLSQENLSSFSYQVFRASANLLELTNYSLTFYIYILFSEDFRATLLRIIRWPWFGGTICQKNNNEVSLNFFFLNSNQEKTVIFRWIWIIRQFRRMPKSLH